VSVFFPSLFLPLTPATFPWSLLRPAPTMVKAEHQILPSSGVRPCRRYPGAPFLLCLPISRSLTQISLTCEPFQLPTKSNMRYREPPPDSSFFQNLHTHQAPPFFAAALSVGPICPFFCLGFVSSAPTVVAQYLLLIQPTPRSLPGSPNVGGRERIYPSPPFTACHLLAAYYTTQRQLFSPRQSPPVPLIPPSVGGTSPLPRLVTPLYSFKPLEDIRHYPSCRSVSLPFFYDLWFFAGRTRLGRVSPSSSNFGRLVATE